ncbi:MAG TPA: DUF4351 domain-containing protein [Humisphaera sp.]|jgi:predicted transposase YdaD|nr:DUF4351 domain-containing protein [Humisphaera sp.]
MDHDRLFKELLRTFFLEFLAAFVPNVQEFIDPSSIEFLDKEVFTDVASNDRHEVDLLIKARFKGQAAFFLVHIENQASAQEEFAARMFRYFARLYEKFTLPIYPIALLSYDKPHRPEPNRFAMEFPGLDVLAFRFDVIQLNRLHWRDFLRHPNPVVAALMTKMQIEPKDRPRVALECLRMIATLKLDPARQTFIHTFMDAYLRLSAEERKVYNSEIGSVAEPERKAVMQILNQWEEHGMRRGEAAVIVRLLTRKFGQVPQSVHEQIADLPQEKLEQLADAVLDFAALEDLHAWLANHG